MPSWSSAIPGNPEGWDNRHRARTASGGGRMTWVGRTILLALLDAGLLSLFVWPRRGKREC